MNLEKSEAERKSDILHAADERVLQNKFRHRMIRAVLYILLSLLFTGGMYFADLYTYRPVSFDPAGEAGVYAEATVEGIQPVTEVDGWCYLFYVNETENTIGILKTTAADYQVLTATAEAYQGAGADYASSVKVRGITEPLDSGFRDACISAGFADSATDTQFSSIYGMVCLCMNTRNVTLFYLLYFVGLYVLFPLTVLWLILCILIRCIKKHKAKKASAATEASPASAAEHDLDDDF